MLCMDQCSNYSLLSEIKNGTKKMHRNKPSALQNAHKLKWN
jgi:hypothetical protein